MRPLEQDVAGAVAVLDQHSPPLPPPGTFVSGTAMARDVRASVASPHPLQGRAHPDADLLVQPIAGGAMRDPGRRQERGVEDAVGGRRHGRRPRFALRPVLGAPGDAEHPASADGHARRRSPNAQLRPRIRMDVGHSDRDHPRRSMRTGTAHPAINHPRFSLRSMTCITPIP
jgi:hypothetical protein